MKPGEALGRAAAEWAVSRRVRAGGIDVRYREAGSGPTVVLVHGLGCSADYWWRNGAPLAAAGLRVLAPDLPGFGRTKGPWRGLDVDEQARALDAWAGALGLEPATYVGHSLSCQAVVDLAADHPGRAAALVLAAPTGDRRKKRRLREAVGFLRDVPREPLSLVPWIAEAYLRAGMVRWFMTWWAGKEHDLFGTARRVRVPSLVLVGADDPVVSERFASTVAAVLPGSRFGVIENAAHALIFDEATAFNAAVLAFVREVMDQPLISVSSSMSGP
ncbi:MAG TPA: alpha/beta hydrolase [Longimicrobium sp.]|nr:alpha/beta hydrolase [Longimicrobium sp.]